MTTLKPRAIDGLINYLLANQDDIEDALDLTEEETTQAINDLSRLVVGLPVVLSALQERRTP